MKYHSRFLYYVISLLFCALTSCNNPKSAGTNAAEEIIKCNEEHAANLQKEISNFIQTFSNQNYKSRLEAREALQNTIANVDEEYREKLLTAQQNYDKYADEYKTDYSNLEEFQDAFLSRMSQYSDEPIDTASLCHNARQLILSIIPTAPNSNKIQADLVGRSWQDSPEGYFGSKAHRIKENEIQKITITKDSKTDNRIDLNVDLVLQEHVGGASYKVNGDVVYILGDADDWTLDSFKANSVEIEKTGRYNDYIRTELVNSFLNKGVNISNNSDAPLIVGGIVYDEYDGWKKFCYVVDANSNKFIQFVKDYEIHFVERV